MEATASQPGATPQAATIRAKTNPGVFWSLVSFVLRDYMRTAWVFLNIAVLVGIHALFFKYPSGQGHFFGVEYAATAVLAAITGAVIFARANRAESYAILARRVPRASYTGAIMLASWLVAVVGYLISTLFDVAIFSPWLTKSPFQAWQTPTNYLLGSVPVLVAAAFAVCLAGLLSSFVSSSAVRLGTMTALALLVMSFDNRNFPVETLRPILQQLPPVLAPIAGALQFATEQSSIATVSLALLAGYALLLAIAVLVLSSSRELILE